MRAERITAGLQSECLDLTRAARPLTWGQDMDVPEIMLNSTWRSSTESPVGPTAPVQPAKMLTPGAIRSGLRMPGATVLGPLELNAATTGAGWIPTLVPSKKIVAVGFESVNTYFLISSPFFAPTAEAGNKCASATSSSPFSSVLASTIPAPPACFTTRPFWTREFIPRSHKTIFPATLFESRVPTIQRFPLVALLTLPA
ncbi:hypothetical protein CDL15_Pgr017166 [Punica granatum]|uniref:Uncharacterized protein n=1 Tax=Punica granatum TaxID=22663 RepID=A0A218VZH8_PUNGR|nr:hypothetical protein CDL15_Pgr017166 [Punica granatum]